MKKKSIADYASGAIEAWAATEVFRCIGFSADDIFVFTAPSADHPDKVALHCALRTQGREFGFICGVYDTEAEAKTVHGEGIDLTAFSDTFPYDVMKHHFDRSSIVIAIGATLGGLRVQWMDDLSKTVWDDGGIITPSSPLNPDGPVPMLLWCPACGERHIEKCEYAQRLHHTHACQHCGTKWRPAIEPTFGVLQLPNLMGSVSSNTSEPSIREAMDEARKHKVKRRS